ncbi:MAG TPA: DUF4173 domain-containing protein [Gemmatimonadales bacterium]|nr:DUF4173 domain-containing protein [Gemmatimonadales bacterium]
MTAITLSRRSHLGLTLLACGLGLGLSGDLLLRAGPWGLNFSIWICALMGVGLWLVRRYDLPVSSDFSWLALSVVLCAVAFVRRDSQALQLIDVAALVGLLSLTALATQGGQIRLRGLSTYLVATVVACAHAWFGTPRLLFSDITWKDVEGGGRWSRMRAVGIGLLVAAPLLLVFGSLFVSADAAFESLVDSLQIDLPTVASHVVLTTVIGGLAAGALRGAVLSPPETAGIGERTASPELRFTSAVTALGALDLLFLVFVGLQLRWLFGGSAVIAETTGLTVAEYARRGFFELVTASALVLPVLLVADWATLVEDSTQRRAFRMLSGLLVALVGVMLVSALQRMLLYVNTFGLTELRLYTTAFMIWLGGVFAWFTLTVLRNRRPRFAFGALAQALVVLGGLHIANPDGLIARVNLGNESKIQVDDWSTDRRRVRQGPIDADYISRVLSADAVPALLDRFSHLTPVQQKSVAHTLLERWGSGTGRDWRSWNWSEWRARTLVVARAGELRALAAR